MHSLGQPQLLKEQTRVVDLLTSKVSLGETDLPSSQGEFSGEAALFQPVFHTAVAGEFDGHSARCSAMRSQDQLQASGVEPFGRDAIDHDRCLQSNCFAERLLQLSCVANINAAIQHDIGSI